MDSLLVPKDITSQCSARIPASHHQGKMIQGRRARERERERKGEGEKQSERKSSVQAGLRQAVQAETDDIDLGGGRNCI